MSKYTYEELVLALDLYMRIPSSKINVRNPEIIELSEFISEHFSEHSVNSVKLLMENYKSCNPNYTGVNDRKGMNHPSKLLVEVWNQFYNESFESLFRKACDIRMKVSGTDMGSTMMDDAIPLEMDAHELDGIPPGEVKQYMTNIRVNQNVFRHHVLASFDNRCCITGIGNETILRASHIKPWRACNPVEKTNPSNGLCLNPLHDQAFDKGLFTINHDLEIVLSPRIDEFLTEETVKTEFEVYEGKQIRLPEKIEIKKEFIDYHNEFILIA